MIGENTLILNNDAVNDAIKQYLQREVFTRHTIVSCKVAYANAGYEATVVLKENVSIALALKLEKSLGSEIPDKRTNDDGK